MKKFALAIALAVASLNAAHAQTGPEATKPVHFLVGMGLTFGGDELASVQWANGDDYKITAGGMIAFQAGVDYRVSPEFSLQGTFAYHFDQANGSNGDMKFTRYPVELLAYYHPTQNWRVGGGLRYVNSPKLSSSGAAYIGNFTFKNTVSPVIEAEYLLGEHLGIKARFVKEEYELKNYNEKYKGDHFGVFMNYYF